MTSDANALSPDFWLLLSLPVVSTMLGWLVNRLLLLFLFGPLPVAAPWQQGAVAVRAVDLARMLADRLSMHLHMSELFRRMEPEKVAGFLSAGLRDSLEEYVDGIMAERHAVLWDNLPVVLKQRVYARVRRQMPELLDNLIDDMAENIEALVDVRALLEDVIARDPGLLGRILDATLAEAQQFLLRAGMLTGLVVGILHMLLYMHNLNADWVLPVLMSLSAVLSVWLPREWLLRAKLPLGQRGWLQRHAQSVWLTLSRHLAEDLISLRQLMAVMFSGARLGRVHSLMRRHMRPLLDAGFLKTGIQLMLGAQGYADIKQLVVERTARITVDALADARLNQARSADVRQACECALQGLDDDGVEALFRPVFAQHWWLQLVCAAVTGALVGSLLCLAS